MFVGSIILFSIIFSDAFFDATHIAPSLGSLSVVMLAALGTTTSGTAGGALVISIVGMALAVIVYIITISVAYGATGGTYDPGTQKILSLGFISTFLVGLLHLLRVSRDALNFPGIFAQLFPAVLIFPAYWEPKLPANGTIGLQFFLFIVAPSMLAWITTTILIPTPGSEQTRALFPKYVAMTSTIEKKVLQLLVKLEIGKKEDDGNGKDAPSIAAPKLPHADDIGDAMTVAKEKNYPPNGLHTFQEGHHIGVDKSIETDFLDIYKLDIIAFKRR